MDAFSTVLNQTTLLDEDLCSYLVNYDKKEFFESMYREYRKGKVHSISNLSLRILITMFKESKIKEETMVSQGGYTV